MATDAANFWNQYAEQYAKDPVKNVDAFERKIAITKSKMTANSTVLDIGCGTGSLCLRLAETGAQVHGLDVSSEMIRIARDKVDAQSVSNTTFHIGPFDQSFSAFESESLDGICAYSILHLLSDSPSALAQMYDLLKPGGFLISSTAVLGESKLPFTPILWLMRALGKAPHHVSVLTKAKLRAQLTHSGFVAVSEPTDVGTDTITVFLVAQKPLGDR